MRTLFVSLLLAFFCFLPAIPGAELKTVEMDWEPACQGSLVTVTLADGKPVLIEAFVEHHFEAREWICILREGKPVSAVYRQHILSRKLAADEVDILVDRKLVRADTFEMKAGRLDCTDGALRADFEGVLKIATGAR